MVSAIQRREANISEDELVASGPNLWNREQGEEVHIQPITGT